MEYDIQLRNIEMRIMHKKEEYAKIKNRYN